MYFHLLKKKKKLSQILLLIELNLAFIQTHMGKEY